jgi:hypothetical protein
LLGMPLFSLATQYPQRVGCCRDLGDQPKQSLASKMRPRLRIAFGSSAAFAHGLIEAHADGRYELTPLGRLAGESEVEVISIIRLVECLRPLQPEHPALIAAVQVTHELNQVYLPLNKKTSKEAQSWSTELARQAVPHHVLRCLARDINEQQSPVRRQLNAQKNESEGKLKLVGARRPLGPWSKRRRS